MLETAIQEEEWKVGEKMPSEPELAEMYGVSRNTVREAVHYLAISGLIEVRQGVAPMCATRQRWTQRMQSAWKRKR